MEIKIQEITIAYDKKSEIRNPLKPLIEFFFVRASAIPNLISALDITDRRLFHANFSPEVWVGSDIGIKKRPASSTLPSKLFSSFK